MKRMCWMILLTTVFLAQGTGCSRTDSTYEVPLYSRSSPSSTLTERILDVPYVSTPRRVVDKMLDMARVGSTDTVYDLGCGDGRLIITAAKERGARGVGVDLNPARIFESNENAAKANVKDRVRFIEQDLFETDFSDATVLTLYLLPEVNLALRPRILSELKPGSRVVSHDFDMKEWKPDNTAVVGNSRIYYWMVPANFSGIWNMHVESEKGSTRFSVIIDQRFQEIEGLLLAGSSQRLLNDGKITGEIIEFTVEQRINGELVLGTFEGRIVGSALQGTMRTGDKEASYAWSAERSPATARPIDGSERKDGPARQPA